MNIESAGAHGRPPLQETPWAKVVAALWIAGVVAAHYLVWVRALLASVPAQR